MARAAEVVAERWTPLILRELLSGSRRFNDIRRGVPLMSPSLLSQRLKTLERAGVVHRRSVAGTLEYTLTAAGEELGPVIEQLAAWGKRWVRDELRRNELDAGLLMWDIRRGIAVERLPEHPLVVHFVFPDAAPAKRYWWLICDRTTVDLCLKDHGFEPAVTVTCATRVLVDVWLGDLDIRDAIRTERLHLAGRRTVVRAFPDLLRLSAVARVRKPTPASKPAKAGTPRSSG